MVPVMASQMQADPLQSGSTNGMCQLSSSLINVSSTLLRCLLPHHTGCCLLHHMGLSYL